MHRLIAAIVLSAGITFWSGPPAAAHQVRPLWHEASEAPRAAPGAIRGEPPGAMHRVVSGAAVSGTAPAPSPLAIAGALLALLALAAAIKCRGRCGAVALGFVFLIFGFESAVHSVHHLGSAEESKCALAGAALHAPGTVGEPVVALAGSLPVSVAAAVAEPVRRAARPWRSWRSRAPPASPIR